MNKHELIASAKPGGEFKIDKTQMTIDFVNFDMTLEVLGNSEDAREFFKTYELETVKDLESMRKFILTKDWNSLKRICHTWKGRNSQIGFRKSSNIAGSLYEFLNSVSDPGYCEFEDEEDEDEDGEGSLIRRQVEMFFESLERECGVINEFLKTKNLLL